MVMIYALCGSIGAGKTTVLQNLELLLKDKCVIAYEPVNIWRNVPSLRNPGVKYNLLDDNYHTKPSAFEFQSLIRCSIIENICKSYEICRNKSSDLLFTERTPYDGGHVFSEIALRDESLDDRQFSILRMNEQLGAKTSPEVHYFEKIFYLHCEPKVALERIQQRNRSEEKGIITGELLENLDFYYKQWLVLKGPDICKEVIYVSTAGEAVNIASLIVEHCHV